MNTKAHGTGLAALLLALALTPGAASADSGFYIGGAAGGATLEADFGPDTIPGLPLGGIDEDDTALEVFAGYHFDLPVVDLGIEVGYVDFDYGAGLAFGLAGIKIRGELEVYDLDGADLTMLSLGMLYQFD